MRHIYWLCDGLYKRSAFPQTPLSCAVIAKIHIIGTEIGFVFAFMKSVNIKISLKAVQLHKFMHLQQKLWLYYRNCKANILFTQAFSPYCYRKYSFRVCILWLCYRIFQHEINTTKNKNRTVIAITDSAVLKFGFVIIV